jgi:hypothetical protein
LSFEKFLEKDVLYANFNKIRYVKSTKERQHVSKNVVESPSDAYTLGINKIQVYRFGGPAYPKFVVCAPVTYDTVLSIFDVNKGVMLLYRFYKFDRGISASIEKMLKTAKNSNFEARLLGMQTNQPFADLHEALGLLGRNKIAISEADLFGNETRNLAYDLKNGMEYDILMENRPYKPGERVNVLSIADFELELPKQVQPPHSEKEYKT